MDHFLDSLLEQVDHVLPQKVSHERLVLEQASLCIDWMRPSLLVKTEILNP